MSESRPTRAEMIEWERARVLAQPREIDPL